MTSSREAGGRGTGDDFRLSLYLGDFVGGDDRLIGGAGSDQILDSVGNDTDVVRGGAGWDSLETYDQDLTADVVDGQAGTDTCHYDAATWSAPARNSPRTKWSYSAECGAGCRSASPSVLRTLGLLRAHPAPHSAPVPCSTKG